MEEGADFLGRRVLRFLGPTSCSTAGTPLVHVMCTAQRNGRRFAPHTPRTSTARATGREFSVGSLPLLGLGS